MPCICLRHGSRSNLLNSGVKETRSSGFIGSRQPVRASMMSSASVSFSRSAGVNALESAAYDVLKDCVERPSTRGTVWHPASPRISALIANDLEVDRTFAMTRLTPELRRTAARNGGVLHASTQAEPRSGLGLNELLAGTPASRF